MLVARVAAAGRGGVGAVVLVTCTDIFGIYFHDLVVVQVTFYAAVARPGGGHHTALGITSPQGVTL